MFSFQQGGSEVRAPPIKLGGHAGMDLLGKDTRVRSNSVHQWEGQSYLEGAY